MDELGLRRQMEATGRNFRMTRSYTINGRHLRDVPNAEHAQAVGGIAVTQRGLVHAVLLEGTSEGDRYPLRAEAVAVLDEGEKVAVELRRRGRA
jgi:hypothetical protein